jgi:hypothetical protein
VQALYFHRGRFACRHCHDLTFASTQSWDARVRRFVRGGLDWEALEDPDWGSLAELKFRLKVIGHQRRGLARCGLRLED